MHRLVHVSLPGPEWSPPSPSRGGAGWGVAWTRPNLVGGGAGRGSTHLVRRAPHTWSEPYALRVPPQKRHSSSLRASASTVFIKLCIYTTSEYVWFDLKEWPLFISSLLNTCQLPRTAALDTQWLETGADSKGQDGTHFPTGQRFFFLLTASDHF